jgi:hypothetical protein
MKESKQIVVGLLGLVLLLLGYCVFITVRASNIEKRRNQELQALNQVNQELQANQRVLSNALSQAVSAGLWRGEMMSPEDAFSLLRATMILDGISPSGRSPSRSTSALYYGEGHVNSPPRDVRSK